MATVNIGIEQQIEPTENIQNILNDLDNSQTKINSSVDSITTFNSASPLPPGNVKVPAKIFDPIFGPNVIFGFVITSDFMSYCDYKPLVRVGDLVFVVGVVGQTIVAEMGTITSGCMDVRNNSIGAGKPYPGGPGTAGLESGCVGQKASPLFTATINADLLNPAILDRIDPCLNSGDLANCLPSIVQDILGLCEESQPNLGYGSIDDFSLENSIRKVGNDFLNKLNDRLKNGLCGNEPLNIKLEANTALNKLNKVITVEDACLVDNNVIQSPQTTGNNKRINNQCVSDHLKYLSDKVDKQTGFTFNDEIGDFISKHDIELISLVNDIETFYDKQFKEQLSEILNKFPSDYPSNFSEAINLAISVAKDVIGYDSNKQESISKFNNIIDDMKRLQEKLQKLTNNNFNDLIDFIKNDPELNRFFNELINERNDALNNLKQPPTDGTDICSKNKGLYDVNGDPLEKCGDLVDLQKMVRDGVANILESVNGNGDKNGLIANSMIKIGVNDVRKATGAAGMNPIDSMSLFRESTITKILKCMEQTAKVKSYLQYSENTSYSLIGEWETFIGIFSGSPRDNAGNLLTTAPLEAILQAIQQQCLTLPQHEIERFALETSEMFSDIRDFKFISMDPNFVGTNPPLSILISNPSIMIPASNIGMILSSAQTAITQCISNISLIKSQLETIIPSKEEMLAEMMAYVKNIVQMGIDSLKSLQGCLPPLPCIQFNGLFKFDTNFKFSISNPFNIKLPIMDLSFPNIEFKKPIILPTIVAPTGFKAAIRVPFPKFKYPRIPNPPKFPPDFKIPTIRLPNLNIPFDLSKINRLIPKFPKVSYIIPLPKVKLPRLNGIIIPPITIKIPKYNIKFGGFPLPKLNIKLPKFPININIKVPIKFDIKVPIPSIDLKLPKIPKPFIKIPSFILNIPKLNIPFSGGITVGTPSLNKISIPFPSITIPSLCGDKGKTIEELIADGKNVYNRILNTGVSGGRPLAVANCSMWVSPHFHGWIAPIPCSALATDFSKCICLT